jgi:hypothetical protein
MQAKYKWLLLPPALASVLMLGPLRPPAPAAAAPATAAPAAAPAAQPADLWPATSTVIGIVLLGTAGCLAFARVNPRKRQPGADLLALRQTLRLSGRHAVHALQFEDRLLLIGECEGSLRLLEHAPDADAAKDEARVADRVEPPEEDGAVPRNLVIPTPPVRRQAALPKPPVARKTAAAAAPRNADFQALLRLARRGS